MKDQKTHRSEFPSRKRTGCPGRARHFVKNWPLYPVKVPALSPGFPAREAAIRGLVVVVGAVVSARWRRQEQMVGFVEPS